MVAERIAEDRHCAIGLVARRFQKGDAFGQHRRMVASEIVGEQEEADAAAGLVADRRLLAFAVGLGKQQRSLDRAPGTDDDPALAIVEPRVFHEVEAELAAIEGDAGIVVRHDQGNACDRLAHQSLASGAAAGSAGPLALRLMLRRIMPRLAPPRPKASAK
ncbi:hypothetical protein D9M70_506390 [compost metagenome]